MYLIVLNKKGSTTLSSSSVDIEIKKCNAFIQTITGKNPFVLSYLYGDYDSRIINICKKYMDYCTTTHSGVYFTSNSSYAMNRVGVYRDDSISKFISSLL